MASQIIVLPVVSHVLYDILPYAWRNSQSFHLILFLSGNDKYVSGNFKFFDRFKHFQTMKFRAVIQRFINKCIDFMTWSVFNSLPSVHMGISSKIWAAKLKRKDDGFKICGTFFNFVLLANSTKSSFEDGCVHLLIKIEGWKCNHCNPTDDSHDVWVQSEISQGYFRVKSFPR